VSLFIVEAGARSIVLLVCTKQWPLGSAVTLLRDLHICCVYHFICLFVCISCNCCSVDAKTDALFNEFLRYDAALDSDVCHGRSLSVQRWRRHFHPPRADTSPPPVIRSPPTAVAERRLRRLGATSGGRRRSRRGSDSVDSPTRPSSFRRPSPHDSIEEEDVFQPIAPDDAQAMSEDRCRHEFRDASNHSGLLSVYNGRRTTAIPTICVREEIETDT